jgi:hypothetical protein
MGYTPPALQVRKIAGGFNVFPPTETTGDNLILYANGYDTYPNLTMLGNGATRYFLPDGESFNIYNAATKVWTIYQVGGSGEVTLLSPVANNNIHLQTTGTGLVKFGTRTAAGDAASNGYITILDDAGNTVKLSTRA